MSAEHRSAERRMTAFMQDPDRPNPGNPIHSTQGGREYGYKTALVGGVTVYGWAVPAILTALGEEWLESGWAEFSFRRPTYPGDQVIARVEPADDDTFTLQLTNQDGDRTNEGKLCLGSAPWLDQLKLPRERTPSPRPDELPRLTLANAPVGRDLRAMAVPISAEEASRFALGHEADDNPVYQGERPAIHPGWVAGRMTRLLHHSYDYGPSIHAKSHIQNRAVATAGQTLTVAGHGVEVYERKGHHYIVADGVMLDESGAELARLRHTTIFQVAKRAG